MTRILTPEESQHYAHCAACQYAVEDAILEELALGDSAEPCVVRRDTGEILFALTPPGWDAGLPLKRLP